MSSMRWPFVGCGPAQIAGNQSKLLQCCLQIIHDLLGNHVGRRQVAGVGEARRTAAGVSRPEALREDPGRSGPTGFPRR